jgi:hypothetical protein
MVDYRLYSAVQIVPFLVDLNLFDAPFSLITSDLLYAKSFSRNFFLLYKLFNNVIINLVVIKNRRID